MDDELEQVQEQVQEQELEREQVQERELEREQERELELEQELEREQIKMPSTPHVELLIFLVVGVGFVWAVIRGAATRPNPRPPRRLSPPRPPRTRRHRWPIGRWCQACQFQQHRLCDRQQECGCWCRAKEYQP